MTNATQSKSPFNKEIGKSVATTIVAVAIFEIGRFAFTKSADAIGNYFRSRKEAKTSQIRAA